jgi:hypothetical protein
MQKKIIICILNLNGIFVNSSNNRLENFNKNKHDSIKIYNNSIENPENEYIKYNKKPIVLIFPIINENSAYKFYRKDQTKNS